MVIIGIRPLQTVYNQIIDEVSGSVSLVTGLNKSLIVASIFPKIRKKALNQVNLRIVVLPFLIPVADSKRNKNAQDNDYKL
jgi:hypothetical protein